MPVKKYLSILFIFIAQNAFAQSFCPPNLDFETGSYANWHFYTGFCCPISTPTLTTSALPNRHVITSGTGVDPYGGFPVVGGGSYSLKLGNDSAGKQAERARYYIHVPAGNSSYILIFRYAIVLQDPGHSAIDQPRFQVSAYDSITGDLIPCSDIIYVSSSSLPGFKLSAKTPPANNDPVVYKDWSSASIFLGAQAAGKTVAVDFATGDCDLNAHFGYAYVDMNCGLYQNYYNMACSTATVLELKGPPGYEKYQWMDSTCTTEIDTGEKIIMKVPDTTTVFALILKPYDGLGCQDTLYTIIANLSIHMPDTTILCMNSGTKNVYMEARVKGNAGPFIYNWTPATGLSCTNCLNPVATVANSIKYTLSVTDTNGCTRTGSTFIRVVEEVEADINLPVDTVCQFQRIKISDTSSINKNDVTYTWDIDSGKIHSGGREIEVSWQTAGLKKIKLKVNNVGGCIRYDSAYIYVKLQPEAAFEIKMNICKGEVVRLYPKKTHDNTLFYWTIDEVTIPETGYVEYHNVSWNSLGRKSIKLFTKIEGGCTASYDTAVRIHEQPEGQILFENIGNICNGDTLVLSTVPGSYFTYEWAPPGLFVENNTPQARAVVTYGTDITLNVRTQWGCHAGDTIHLNTERCCKLLLPDAFAPKGSGKNTKFRILTKTGYTIYTFMITNRWGTILYNTSDNSGWDGYYKGELQPSGAYFYYIKYACQAGREEEAKGTFLLLK